MNIIKKSFLKNLRGASNIAIKIKFFFSLPGEVFLIKKKEKKFL
jgi:hypothetical protein